MAVLPGAGHPAPATNDVTSDPRVLGPAREAGAAAVREAGPATLPEPCVLLKVGEIVLKGGNRHHFERILQENIRRAVRERVTSGELRVLVGCSAFLEGFDLPAIETVILARALGTCSAYLQGVGRGLRPSLETGKDACTVIDLTGAAVVHGLPADERTWSLTGAAVQRSGDALVALARCASCFAVFHAGPASCPRCGASTRGATVKRRATRIERQELARLDTRPAWVRDEMALRAIVSRMPRFDRRTGRPLSEAEVAVRAVFVFTKSHGRAPARRTVEAA